MLSQAISLQHKQRPHRCHVTEETRWKGQKIRGLLILGCRMGVRREVCVSPPGRNTCRDTWEMDRPGQSVTFRLLSPPAPHTIQNNTPELYPSSHAGVSLLSPASPLPSLYPALYRNNSTASMAAMKRCYTMSLAYYYPSVPMSTGDWGWDVTFGILFSFEVCSGSYRGRLYLRYETFPLHQQDLGIWLHVSPLFVSWSWLIVLFNWVTISFNSSRWYFVIQFSRVTKNKMFIYNSLWNL